MRTPAFWQTKNWLSHLLLPCSYLYRLGFWLDRASTKQDYAPLPVISIGNITAGGAGKTPTTIALAHLLRELGETPHIVTRGYGGTIRNTHAVDLTNDDAKSVGDEALLLAKAAPTWVSPDRLKGAKAAHQAGATIILADDALQHHALHHDLSVLVIDLTYGLGNERLLPAGPLRQTLSSATSNAATIPVLIGENDTHNLAPRFHNPWRAAIAPTADTGWLREHKWLAFAGIAYPGKFYNTLKAHGAVLGATRDFADHHPYTVEEITALLHQANDAGLKLITTEKDAVRLPPNLREAVHVLPVALDWQHLAQIKQDLVKWRESVRHLSAT